MHNHRLTNCESVSLPNGVPCNRPRNRYPCIIDTSAHPTGWLGWLTRTLRTCPSMLKERHTIPWLVLFASVPVTAVVAVLVVRCTPSCPSPGALSVGMQTMLMSHKLCANCLPLRGCCDDGNRDDANVTACSPQQIAAASLMNDHRVDQP